MKNIELKEDELKQSFINQMKHFLENSKSSINLEQLNQMFSELDKYEPSLATYWDCALNYSVKQWVNSNHQLTDLWKKTAINSANLTNYPHLVANNVVDEYKKTFKINN